METCRHNEKSISLNIGRNCFSNTEKKSYSSQAEASENKWSSITMWKERWFLSCNAKDIGTLYLMFAVFSGLAGTAFSVLYLDFNASLYSNSSFDSKIYIFACKTLTIKCDTYFYNLSIKIIDKVFITLY